jgi:ribA/ribD-fused uncharacterized protein
MNGDTMSEIKGFFGPYRFLSNFFPANVHFADAIYPTVEHAYQAAKFQESHRRDMIKKAVGPRHAKLLARSMPITTANWEEMKADIMYDLVYYKFSHDDRLQEKLLATGDAYLEETNHWGDNYWGVCNGEGQNVLGNILMEVRTLLRSQTTKQSQL